MDTITMITDEFDSQIYLPRIIIKKEKKKKKKNTHYLITFCKFYIKY